MVVMYAAMGVPMDVSEFGRQECPSLPFAEWRERRSQEAFGAVLVPVLTVRLQCNSDRHLACDCFSATGRGRS